MSHYLVRTSRMSYASFVLAPWSYNAKNLQLRTLLRTYMLNLRLIFASKTVESQTIFLRIDQLDELALDTNHRRSIGNAFEH